MKDIKELLETAEPYQKVLHQKIFESKKHTVAYVLIEGKPRVLKWYAPGFKKNMENEYQVLTQGSSGVPMPLVYEIDIENNVLVLQYIAGKNLSEVLNDKHTSFQEKKNIVEAAAQWFISFHSFFKTHGGFRIRGDCSLRNFILSHRDIFGVDFEESRYGKPIEDLSGFCASLLSTNPMFTKEKIELCEHFITAYKKAVKWTLENINEEVAYALLEKIQWRPEQEEILRKYATRIRTEGLKGK